MRRKNIIILAAGAGIAAIIIGVASSGGGGTSTTSSSNGGSTSDSQNAASILQANGYTEFPAADPNAAAPIIGTSTPATYAADLFLPFQAGYAASGGTEASGYTGDPSAPTMEESVVTLPGNGMTLTTDNLSSGITGLQNEASASGVTLTVNGDVVTISGTAAAVEALASSGGDFG